jgi:FMN phosphatase YigB (HAD superfamily)
MPETQTWLLDFDETLATSGLTWAFQKAFPKLVREHRLEFDADRFEKVMLVVQEHASQNPEPAPLLKILFKEMGWPHNLQDELFNDLMSGYQPNLYEDTLPFLERLRERNRQIYVVSNNRLTPENVRLLGLDHYFHGVLTPDTCPGTGPKPDSSLWEYLRTQEEAIKPETSVVIGDDPWSEGAFAERCGLGCWIVDRMNRFTGMYDQKAYRWVNSLLEITV